MRIVAQYLACTNILSLLCLVISYVPVYLFSMQGRFPSMAHFTIFLLYLIFSLWVALSLHYTRTAILEKGADRFDFDLGRDNLGWTYLIMLPGMAVLFGHAEDTFFERTINVTYGLMIFAAISYIHIRMYNKACKQILRIAITPHPNPLPGGEGSVK